MKCVVPPFFIGGIRIVDSSLCVELLGKPSIMAAALEGTIDVYCCCTSCYEKVRVHGSMLSVKCAEGKMRMIKILAYLLLDYYTLLYALG